MTPDDALTLLMHGNLRFVNGNLRHPRRGNVRRAELAQGQAPFAVIVSCSDSRVALEIIFDQGLGDLFVVRVAGNTAASPLVIGSVEYSTVVLGSALVMVLGHEECGAVEAAIDVAVNGTEHPGDLPAVVAPIAPAVEHALSLPEDERLEAAIRANVRNQVRRLSAVPLLADRVEKGTLMIVGAQYHFHTGRVRLIDGE